MKIHFSHFLAFITIALALTLSLHYTLMATLNASFVSIHEWKLSQFFYSYNYEFMKRALVGSLFELFSIQPNQTNIFIFSISTIVLFFFSIYIWFEQQLSAIDFQSKLAIMLLFLISPATAMHAGYDLGRFDFITLIMTLIMLFLSVGRITHTKIFFISLLTILALLTHEAFFFLHFFVVLAVLTHSLHNTDQSIWKAVPVILTAIITLMILALFGKSSPETVELITAAIHNAALPINEDSLAVLKRTLIDNITLTLEQLTHGAIRDWLIQAALLFSLYAFVFWKSLDIQQNPLTAYEKLVFLSPLFSLPMFILGYDFFRWFSLMIINLFIVSAYLIHTREIHTIAFIQSKTFKTILLLLIALPIAGPMGIVKLFPLKNWLSVLF